MLAELRISSLGVIDDAVIEPSHGLTVVTGETGAGKTMVVTALGLVCGGRADSGRVRTGAKRAVVEARFTPRDNQGSSANYLADAAEAVGGDIDDDASLVTVRTVSADGRSRGHIGGRSAPVSALASLTEQLVTIHGQSEARSLLRPAAQRAVLDTYASLDADLDRYRELRNEHLAVTADVTDRKARARERAQRESMLRLGLDEIAAADPKPGEDAALVDEIRRHGDADALRDAVSIAVASLTGSVAESDPAAVTGAVANVHAAVKALEQAAGSDPALAMRLDDLHSVTTVIDDVGSELAGYLVDLDADPQRLETLLQRQTVLRTLVRKYGEDVDGVLAWARDATAELDALDSSEDALAEQERRAASLGEQMAAAAATLTAKRTAAAAVLGEAATGQLDDLAMGKATLRVEVTGRDEYGPDGADTVEILLTPHAGAPELPVAKCASGGELSRVMLALEVVLADADPVATLVFDEVDAGVGGRAATEIGRKLAALAATHQVIVVTHLAQVAAFADHHYVVDADADGRVGASAVMSVTGQERLAELARMLGGTDGDVAKAHAADLLAAAVTA